MSRRTLLLTLFAIPLLITPLAGRADSLDDIMKAKVLKVAVPQDFPPFGSVTSDLKPVGYDIDNCSNSWAWSSSARQTWWQTSARG